jgi:GNAT superfamily N-acetyltransferase
VTSSSALTVRPATDDELIAVAALRARSWQAAYAGLVVPDRLAGMAEPDRLSSWARRMVEDAGTHTLVAEREGGLIGFSSFGRERTVDGSAAVPGRGEIYALYVDPPAWRSGAGTALVLATLEELRSDGMGAVSLWVLEGNERAVAFYLTCGFAPTGDRSGGDDDQLPESRYARRL